MIKWYDREDLAIELELTEMYYSAFSAFFRASFLKIFLFFFLLSGSVEKVFFLHLAELPFLSATKTHSKDINRVEQPGTVNHTLQRLKKTFNECCCETYGKNFVLYFCRAHCAASVCSEQQHSNSR